MPTTLPTLLELQKNDAPSMYGWGALIVAGGGAYYFAKREIDADRRQKHIDMVEKQRKQHLMEQAEFGNNPDRPRSKYEASVPYISPKGDRFS
ncbi:hypothetical protein FPQ18DRAFT_399406 [Pyronema domesticum]|nr:hypothetical protein FPQ18DRAFT_399406 [Pyronema domesticum]